MLSGTLISNNLQAKSNILHVSSQFNYIPITRVHNPENPDIKTYVTARHSFERNLENLSRIHYGDPNKDTIIFKHTPLINLEPREISNKEIEIGEELLLHSADGIIYGILVKDTVKIGGRELAHSANPIHSIIQGFSGSPTTDLEGRVNGVLSHINPEDNSVFISTVTPQDLYEFNRKISKKN